jgi:hypothetical protein
MDNYGKSGGSKDGGMGSDVGCCGPVANPHNVGPQGAGGSHLVSGSEVPGVHNPRGITPKVIGKGMGSLVQVPVQPKVGK